MTYRVEVLSCRWASCKKHWIAWGWTNYRGLTRDRAVEQAYKIERNITFLKVRIRLEIQEAG